MMQAGARRSFSKTVLLITREPGHKVLYEKGLRSHFNVEFSPSAGRCRTDIDAVIYDIAATHSSRDLQWLRSVDKPIVILTPEDELPLPEASNRCVLTYPVSMDRILSALTDLGVESSQEDSGR